MNLYQKIDLIEASRENIKAAIIEKGVIPEGNISTYADAIEDIDTVNNTNITISPSTTQESYTAGEYTGFGTIQVEAVTASIDENLVPENVKSGIKILDVEGTYVGSSVNLESVVVEPTTTTQMITPPSGVNGYNLIQVKAVTASIDGGIVPENIKSGVNILGVEGTYEGSSVNLESVVVEPLTTTQMITPPSGVNGYNLIQVKAVKASIDSDIVPENIKSGVNILGVEGTYVGSVGATREVSSQGLYQMPANSFTFSLPSTATNIGPRALYYAFYNCTSLTNVDLSNLINLSGESALESAFDGCTGLGGALDLSNLTTISGNLSLYAAFRNCTGLTSVDLSSLTSVSGSSALNLMFGYCTGLISVDLSNLTTASGYRGLNSMFWECTGLTSVNLSSLTTVSGSGALSNMFHGCTGLTSVDLSGLTNISVSQALQLAFSGCTSLKTLSFPSLTSESFGSYTSQFDNMLKDVTGCTVHFPSNLESVIGSWTSVAGGFGGIDTVVLFDLPSTSTNTYTLRIRIYSGYCTYLSLNGEEVPHATGTYEYDYLDGTVVNVVYEVINGRTSTTYVMSQNRYLEIDS